MEGSAMMAAYLIDCDLASISSNPLIKLGFPTCQPLPKLLM